MKNSAGLAVVLCFFCLGHSLFAQNTDMTRKEYRDKRKALKDSAREYYWNLEKLDALLNARDTYREKNDSLLKAYQDLLAEFQHMQSIQDEAHRLSDENDKLNQQVNALQKNQSKKETVTTPEIKPKPALLNKIPDLGTYFTVQVGAYTYNNYSDISKKAQGETIIIEKNNGLNKYLIGLFENYEEANRLKNKLLALGIPEAWIVAYKDGLRVPMSTVRNQ